MQLRRYFNIYKWSKNTQYNQRHKLHRQELPDSEKELSVYQRGNISAHSRLYYVTKSLSLIITATGIATFMLPFVVYTTGILTFSDDAAVIFVLCGSVLFGWGSRMREGLR